MKVLAIIDAQKDFINGSMGVGLDKWNPAKAEILKLIEKENYDGFIYTQDWHPENHCSFKEQNGPWPSHCVANSEGAKIDFDLSGMQGSLTTKIIRKGRDENKEEYGEKKIINSKKREQENYLLLISHQKHILEMKNTPLNP